MRITQLALALAGGLAFTALAADSSTREERSMAPASTALSPAIVADRADSLLAVDQNRSEIVAGLVAKWKDHLASGKEGDLSKALMGLRADKLLALSLAQDQKQFAALLEKDDFLPTKGGAVSQAKALGDPNADVVYVPLTPCRIFYTEIASGGAGGALLPGVTRTFSTRGSLTGQGGAAGCSVPPAATAIVLQMGAFSSFGLGWINAGPQGSPIPSGVLLAYNNVAFINATSVVLKLNPANGQFSAFSNNNQTELYGDVLGYFARPTNYTGTTTVTGIGATVGGGSNNAATANQATVAGGLSNAASAATSTVSGGESNVASGRDAVVIGGFNNTASGGPSTVLGGWDNVAQGVHSIAAGRLSQAGADYSMAFGRRARIGTGNDCFAIIIAVPCTGAMVFADSSDFDFAPIFGNSFNVRATGGFRFVTNIDSAGGPTKTFQIFNGNAAAEGSMTAVNFITSSDRNIKTAIEKLNVRDVLAKVIALPVSSWSFKGESTRHIGPMAQDFAKAFQVGASDRHIATVDADGVALAAIQGLHQVVKEKDAKISKLERELAAIKKKLGL